MLLKRRPLIIIVIIIIIIIAVLLTADHSHTLSMGGYTSRFHDITGVVDDHMDFNDDAEDGGALTILSYGNGKGFYNLETTGAGDWRMIDRNPLDRNTAADHEYNFSGHFTAYYTFIHVACYPLH